MRPKLWMRCTLHNDYIIYEWRLLIEHKSPRTTSIYKCPNVGVSKSLGVQKLECPNTRVSYLSVQMSKCPKSKVCLNVRLLKSPSVQIPECPNVRVPKCPSVGRLSGSTWPAWLNSGPPVPGQVQSPRLRGGSGGRRTGRLRAEGRSEDSSGYSEGPEVRWGTEGRSAGRREGAGWKDCVGSLHLHLLISY